MELTIDEIKKNQDQYLTTDPKVDDWNYIHGGPLNFTPKVWIYFILPWIDPQTGSTSCMKVCKGFLFLNFKQLVLGSEDIIGLQNRYCGKYINLSRDLNDYCKNLRMFTDPGEARLALKNFRASEEQRILKIKLTIINEEISELQDRLVEKRNTRDKIKSKLKKQ